MAWSFKQSSGQLSHDGEPIEIGYSGNGVGLNNPAEQGTANVGPIPQGTYGIGAAVANGGHMGPFVLPLTPNQGNTMFNRSGFFIHGDRVDGPPHTASDGCIIMSRGTRNDIAASADNTLIVVA